MYWNSLKVFGFHVLPFSNCLLAVCVKFKFICYKVEKCRFPITKLEMGQKNMIDFLVWILFSRFPSGMKICPVFLNWDILFSKKRKSDQKSVNHERFLKNEEF